MNEAGQRRPSYGRRFGPAPEPRADPAAAMKLSFVIPAHDEEALIAQTIDSIRASVEPLGRDYEIIVAADGCTDATASIAAAHGAIVVAHARRQIAATRNLGARAATGDVLVFVDADTRVHRVVIEEMLEILAAGAIGGGGPVALDGPVPLYARLMLKLLITIFRTLRLTGGAFLFCTRRAFDAAGGWDEAYYAGEELMMAQRLKHQGRFRLTVHPVTTSGRKLRTHSPREVLALSFRAIFTPWITKDRSKLDFFYGPRRKDPMRP